VGVKDDKVYKCFTDESNQCLVNTPEDRDSWTIVSRDEISESELGWPEDWSTSDGQWENNNDGMTFESNDEIMHWKWDCGCEWPDGIVEW